MSDFFEFDPDNDEVVSREIIEHEAPATDRSQARRIALQGLFEIDSTGHGVGDVITHLVTDNPGNRKIKRYMVHLIKGVIEHHVNLDAVLQTYAPEWPIHQVAPVDRNILRIALYEMGVATGTPLGVAIDEAIELAKLFGSENSPRFINGVLGSIADNLDVVRSSLTATAEASTNEESVE